MKILLAHNSYRHPGGEDVVVATEARLLAERGHRVVWYRRSNDDLPAKPGLHGIAMGLSTIWSSKSYRALKDVLERERPDVAHFHNTFPRISPAAYFACAKADIPVVQTLHNYRLLCPAATLFRDGHVCEMCVGRALPWQSVVHACYRHSSLATAAAAAMITAHRALGSWQTKVDAYIAVSEFARKMFVKGRLPADRIHVKPNSVHPDPGAKEGRGGYALFVGRLSEEKGLRVLLNAWSRLASPVPLLIAGEGPMGSEIAAAASADSARIKLLGPLKHEEILSLMHGARFLVFPSMLYETSGLAIIEAFACGLPAIASRAGPMADAIAHGDTGLHFQPGNSGELASLCDWAWAHPNDMQEMGRAARAQYEARYTPKQNYELLLDIYTAAIDVHRRVPAIGIPEPVDTGVYYEDVT